MALENTSYEEAAKPILVELARYTKSSALFGLIVGDRIVITQTESSGQALESRMKPGRTYPLFYGAHGKVLVASLPPEEQQELFATRKVAFEGEPSDVSYDDVKGELELCRRKGFAHRVLAGPKDIINLLAAAVLGASGRPIGALFIVGVFRKSVAQRYGAKVAESAKHLSMLLAGKVAHGGSRVVGEAPARDQAGIGT